MSFKYTLVDQNIDIVLHTSSITYVLLTKERENTLYIFMLKKNKFQFHF
jgi:hypothetical protein